MTLTPEEIKKYREQYGITPVSAPTASSQQPKNTGTARDIYQDVINGASKYTVESLGAFGEVGGFIGNQTAGRVINAVQGRGFVPTKMKDPSLLTQEGSPELKARNTAEMVGKSIGFGVEVALPSFGKIKKGFDIATDFIRSGSKTAKTGEAIPAVKYAVSRVPKLLGIFSGESDDVIRNALKNPDAANLGIQNGDAALRQVVTEGSENSVKLRDTFVRAYSEAKKQAIGDYTKVLIPKNNVKGIFNNLLTENGVKFGKEGLDFSTSKIVANPGEIKKIEDAWKALDNWDSFTIDSLDEYKQLIGKLTRFADDTGTPSKSPFLGRFYNELNEIAANKLPADIAEKYRTLNKGFSEKIEMYDDIVDAFNSGDPFTKLSNALGKNKDTMRNVLEFYEKESGKSVLPVVAGRELAMEKTAAFGLMNPRSWIDLLVSPEKQAKIITEIGRKFPKLNSSATTVEKKVIDKVSKPVNSQGGYIRNTTKEDFHNISKDIPSSEIAPSNLKKIPQAIKAEALSVHDEFNDLNPSAVMKYENVASAIDEFQALVQTGGVSKVELANAKDILKHLKALKLSTPVAITKEVTKSVLKSPLGVGAGVTALIAAATAFLSRKKK